MNEIAIIPSYDITGISQSAEIMDALRTELGADYRPDFAFCKTPSSARTVWDIMASDDDTDPEMAKTIEGVILHAHKNYAWWANKLDSGVGGGQPTRGDFQHSHPDGDEHLHLIVGADQVVRHGENLADRLAGHGVVLQDGHGNHQQPYLR